MTPNELALALKTACQVDAGDYRNNDDEDDYINAALYELPDKRLFRFGC